VVGLKATYGLVSIRGIIPLTFSLDHCGPITRTVEDAALMLNALAGYDKLDIASVDHSKEDYAAAMSRAGAKLTLLRVIGSYPARRSGAAPILPHAPHVHSVGPDPRSYQSDHPSSVVKFG
jgi:Asp-tRNA(Asn)/Glu-tRNA(Gln) amidotransferase A subunit family amidase